MKTMTASQFFDAAVTPLFNYVMFQRFDALFSEGKRGTVVITDDITGKKKTCTTGASLAVTIGKVIGVEFDTSEANPYDDFLVKMNEKFVDFVFGDKKDTPSAIHLLSSLPMWWIYDILDEQGITLFISTPDLVKTGATGMPLSRVPTKSLEKEMVIASGVRDDRSGVDFFDFYEAKDVLRLLKYAITLPYGVPSTEKAAKFVTLVDTIAEALDCKEYVDGK